MLLFCRQVIINQRRVLQEKGPLLLAANHPNSFLDAVILDALFTQPVWSLARGDVFKSKVIIKLLTAIRILPVYRVSEGVENLSANYDTFQQCKQLFKDNQVVLIFSEGKCINEWHLRPLKKGTARLAISSWQDAIPVRVLPVGINYSSFRRFGKNVFIHFGTPITEATIPPAVSEGLRIQHFNNALNTQLKGLVWEIGKHDREKQKAMMKQPVSLLKKIILFLPAIVGVLFHAPLYLPLRQFTFRKANHNDHYDSILTALLLFAYPAYLLIITGITIATTGNWYALLLLIALPFTAWSYTQLKGQMDKKIF